MFIRPRFACSLLFLPAATQLALAQPPDAPSTIKRPAENPFRGPVAPPDPPQITPAELQTLTGGPTLVTLGGENLPLQDVTKALLEAGGVAESMVGNTEEKQTVSVDWKQTPFWVAARDLEKQTKRTWDGRFGDGLSLVRFSGQLGLGLNGGLVAQTPFVNVIANSIARSSTRTITFGEKAAPPAVTESVRLTLSAYFDPKLGVQSSALRALKFQKKGEALPANGPEDRFGYNFSPGRTNLISQLNLVLPPQTAAGTVFSRISGELHTVLVSKKEVFSVPDIIAAPNTIKTVGRSTYTLQSATSENGQLKLRVSATLADGANQNWGFYSNNAFANLKVRDAQNRVLQNGGSSISGGPKSQGDFTYSLNNREGKALQGPFSLEWPIVTETKSLDIPFELRDVVVP